VFELFTFDYKPTDFIRTFALIATAEYCLSCIAFYRVFSKVYKNFAFISGRFKSPFSISSFNNRETLGVISLTLHSERLYFAATCVVIE
tara:strand:- start:141 stop:407 length:267 start_codon:yes stop_codon:yes gene_type:complete